MPRELTTLGSALAVRGGELEDSFERIYVDAWPRVLKYVWLLVRDLPEAEDLTAEALRRGYVAWSSGRLRGRDPIPWLLLTARRLVINRARRRALIAWIPLAGEPHVVDVNDALARSESAIWFRQLARLLPARQYEVLVLRYQLTLPDAETARIMAISEAGVRSLAWRALETLRRHPEVLE